MGLDVLLTAIMLVLKSADIIDWSWLVVFSPMIVSTVIWLGANLALIEKAKREKQ